MSLRGASLRARAETLAGPLPPLLADAEHLAATVLLGEHGRRRAGMGDEFWQYRAAAAGDEARSIDWRRSGRSDGHFVREKEWQAAQSVQIWADDSRAMTFASETARRSKGARARLLALALSVLLVRGGERVGLLGTDLPPRSGNIQLLRLAAELDHPDEVTAHTPDFGVPPVATLLPRARALFMSDFLGNIEPVERALHEAADMGVRGVIYQVLDPAEESFPYEGRTIFESMGGALRHETLRAGHLRDAYLDRLAARKARLQDLARGAGWRYGCHHTGDSARVALYWLYQALERRR